MRLLALACACALATGAQGQATRTNGNGHGGANGNGQPAAPAYEDRLIEGLSPQADAEDGKDRYEAKGWPRFLRLETRLGTEPNTKGSKLEGGIGAIASIETPNHGVISVDASWSRRDDGSLVTVRQRALPVGEGWFVNNEAGVITPLGPDVMRIPGRVFVPSAVLLGAGTEWRGAGSTSLLASSGRLGRIQGYPTPGFKPLQGSISIVGAQARAEGWIFAAREAYANDVTELDEVPPGTPLITARSSQFAARREGDSTALQANVVATRSNEVSGTRYGAWVDGEWRSPGGSTQAFGAYHLDRDLKWAGLAMASDIEGAYVRGAYHTRPVSAQASLDVYRSTTGDDATGILVTATGQWRYSRQLSFGAGTTLRRYRDDAGNGYVESSWQHGFGRSNLRAELSNSGTDRTARLVYDHDWLSPLGWMVGARLSTGREEIDGVRGRLAGFALTLSGDIGNDVTVAANLATERRSRGDRYDNAAVTLSWRLGAGWWLDGNVYYNHGRLPLVEPLDPLAPPPTRITTTNDASYFLALRYEERAGTRTAPLGGLPGTGGGAVRGIVYLDGNRNGKRDAGEPGAPGVTIYLDGRFAARTDAQGRFEFPMVAAGARRLTVLNETLPLPWVASGGGEVPVEVILREAVEVAIPVVRPD